MPFKIVRDDITRMKVDVIVKAVSPEPACGQGAGSAVWEKAGPKGIYIIRAVGPVRREGECGEAVIRRCYENSLRLAEAHGCKSIAFPLIFPGTQGGPTQEDFEAAVSAIGGFLAGAEMLVYLVVLEGESFALSSGVFSGVKSYIQEHYAEKKTDTEYSAPQALPVPVAYAAFPEREERCRKTAVSVRSLEAAVAQLGETFQERLLRLMDQRGMTEVELYKRANLDRKLFSKIRCNVHYRPKKITAIALAVALGLNLDETKDLLSRAELALSPSSKFDLIIQYFIEREIYDIYTINLALFEHDQPLLGEP